MGVEICQINTIYEHETKRGFLGAPPGLTSYVRLEAWQGNTLIKSKRYKSPSISEESHSFIDIFMEIWFPKRLDFDKIQEANRQDQEMYMQFLQDLLNEGWEPLTTNNGKVATMKRTVP